MIRPYGYRDVGAKNFSPFFAWSGGPIRRCGMRCVDTHALAEEGLGEGENTLS
jgi:hypothetical protein